MCMSDKKHSKLKGWAKAVGDRYNANKEDVQEFIYLEHQDDMNIIYGRYHLVMAFSLMPGIPCDDVEQACKQWFNILDNFPKPVYK